MFTVLNDRILLTCHNVYSDSRIVCRLETSRFVILVKMSLKKSEASMQVVINIQNPEVPETLLLLINCPSETGITY